jgi:hypothetical protein
MAPRFDRSGSIPGNGMKISSAAFVAVTKRSAQKICPYQVGLVLKAPESAMSQEGYSHDKVMLRQWDKNLNFLKLIQRKR